MTNFINQIYGSARLGSLKTKVDVFGTAYTAYSDVITTHAIGDRNYELSNHLGNFNDTWFSCKESLSGINPDWSHSGISGVLTVVSDKLIPKFESSAPTIVSSYTADLVMSCDYSPFGVTLDGRGVEGSYRYGFNSMEADDEIKGDGNSYDFGMRLYDARVARFISIDPMKERNSHESNYTYASDNPIVFMDLEGGDNVVYLFVPKDGALENVDKNNAICQKVTAAKIAVEANKMFETMNVGTRVVVFEGTYAEFQAMQIDNTDRRALVGTAADGNVFLEDNGYTKNELIPCGDLDLSPHVIAVQNDCDEAFITGLNVYSSEEVHAFGIVHGTAHTAGVAHCGNKGDQPLDDEECVPDYKTDDYKVNYASNGTMVKNRIGRLGETPYDLMAPSRAPLTIFGHIKAFEPKRYQAIVEMAFAEAMNQGFTGPDQITQTFGYALNLLTNPQFVTTAINSSTPSPAVDNRKKQ